MGDQLYYNGIMCKIDAFIVNLKISQSLCRPITTTLFVLFTNVYQ